ncbi:peptidase associated/transthyretin-like domain-containing protein [Halostagnicola bangensis]
MGQRDYLTRRQVSSLIGTGLAIGVAGCTDDDGDDSADGNETDPGLNDDSDGGEDVEEGSLVVFLEDEDGESVSEGVAVEIDAQNENHRYIVDEGIEDGVAEPEFIEAGSYTVVAEGEAYESAEADVTLEEGEAEEITLELEASS